MKGIEQPLELNWDMNPNFWSVANAKVKAEDGRIDVKLNVHVIGMW